MQSNWGCHAMLARALATLTLLSMTTPAMTSPVANPLPSAFDAGWHGEKVCEPIFENATMRAARCTFPPGGGHDRHFHPAHWGYIVEGSTMRITAATGTVDRDLKAGTSWWSDGIDWHEAVNIGKTTAVYIIVEPKAAP